MKKICIFYITTLTICQSLSDNNTNNKHNNNNNRNQIMDNDIKKIQKKVIIEN